MDSTTKVKFHVILTILGKDVKSPPKAKSVITKMSSPKRSDQKSFSTIPHALAQGAIAAAKKTTQEQAGEIPKHLSNKIHMVVSTCSTKYILNIDSEIIK